MYIINSSSILFFSWMVPLVILTVCEKKRVEDGRWHFKWPRHGQQEPNKDQVHHVATATHLGLDVEKWPKTCLVFFSYWVEKRLLALQMAVPRTTRIKFPTWRRQHNKGSDVDKRPIIYQVLVSYWIEKRIRSESKIGSACDVVISKVFLNY